MLINYDKLKNNDLGTFFESIDKSLVVLTSIKN